MTPRRPAASAPAVWPDPFALPSGTTLRFGLLVLAMSAAVMSTGSFLTGWLFIDLDRFTPRELRECLRDHLADLTADNPTPPPQDFLQTCGAPPESRALAASLSALALFWAVSLALYWVRPAYRIRARRLRPFPADRLPEQVRELKELKRLAGVGEPVVFLVDLLDPTTTGLAFGRPGRRYVALSRGLLQLHGKDPRAFRAVVLHELAHIRNRDVDVAFITDTAWRVFLLQVVIPGIVGFPLLPLFASSASGMFAFYFLSALNLALLGVVVPLARNAVLHSRELHADARAARLGEAASGLTDVLAGQHAQEERRGAEERAKTEAKRRRKGRSPKTDTPSSDVDIVYPHPSAARRLRALADPSELFEIGPGVAFGLGLACTLAHEPIAGLMTDVFGVSRYGPWAALPVAAVLGVGMAFAVWRAELAACLSGRVWDGAHAVGKGLGTGLAAGTLGSQMYAASVGTTVQTDFSVLVLWWATLAVGGYLYALWLAGAVRAWGPVVLCGRRPLVPVLAVTGVSVVLLSIWLSYLLQLASWSDILSTMSQWRELPPPVVYFIGVGVQLAFGMETPAATMVLLLTVALLPLLGGAFSRRTAGPPRRLLLDSPPSDWRPAQPAPGPGAALRTGLVISGTAAGLFFTVHVVCAFLAPELLLWSTFPQGLLLAGVIQSFAAVAAARKARVLRPLQGILAAAAAGAVLHIAVLFSRDHFACIVWGYGREDCAPVPRAVEWRIALHTQSWGLLAATVVVLLWTWRHGRRRRPPSQSTRAASVTE